MTEARPGTEARSTPARPAAKTDLSQPVRSVSAECSWSLGESAPRQGGIQIAKGESVSVTRRSPANTAMG
jgi:hypothetical protein